MTSEVWRCFSGPIKSGKAVERHCRIGHAEDGSLCRVQVDASHPNEQGGAKYPHFKKDGKNMATTASFGRHLKDKHPGWIKMLQDEDARSMGVKRTHGTLLSSFPIVDESTKKKQKTQV